MSYQHVRGAEAIIKKYRAPRRAGVIKGGEGAVITRIGIVAGIIWNLLEKRKEMNLSGIVSETEKPEDIVLMSLGWLAREGHIVVEGEEDYTISLRKK